MSRRSLANLLSGQEPALGEVWRWYEFQRGLVLEERNRVLIALRNGDAIDSPRYLDKTYGELETVFKFQMDELDLYATLGMFACTEAALRVDCIRRIAEGKKDNVSRKFREIYKPQTRLEAILAVLKDHGSNYGIKGAVAEFKGALSLRDWLAHGRYWKPKLGRAAGYDPKDVFELCSELLQRAGIKLMS